MPPAPLPPGGLLITQVLPEGNAARARLQAGDVLVAYAGVYLTSAEQLGPLVLTMVGAVFGWPILLALALQRTTSAHAAVIAAFMPLTTAVIAVLRTREGRSAVGVPVSPP